MNNDLKYKVTVTGIGSFVEELAADNDCIIIYNDDINNDDLKDISVTHTVAELKDGISENDTLTIGEVAYKITAIGNVALNTLRELGHCTLKFDGLTEVNLPGEIHVDGVTPKVKIGDVITIS